MQVLVYVLRSKYNFPVHTYYLFIHVDWQPFHKLIAFLLEQ